MSPRFGTCSRTRYESKASELNSKLETDYNDCIGMLVREKLQQSSQDQLSTTEIPGLITTSTDDGKEKQKTLSRGQSSRGTSNLTATQKKFLASSENGIVAPRTSMKSCLSLAGDDESTVPTFLSVGNWQNNPENNTVFLVSKNGDEKPPILKRVSLEARTRMNGVRDAVHDREFRKRLHYKEKLRVLTDRLTTNSALERSREMLTKIVDKNSVVGKEGTNPEQYDPKYKKIIDGARKKLYACSMRMCFDDAVVDHEGLIIAIPEQSLGCRCDEDSNYTELDGDLSEVSSLTGATRYRFQSQYWRKHHRERDMWI
mmetsp:Transcript_50760/g.108174  ORF Transcript_50760/g.108174 Transcript_50760/m.108174 type:complete len:315 (+) Transcript_50760:95-1039(+)